jgi:two-component system, OmpR family, KDP operon response regulator KdpE
MSTQGAKILVVDDEPQIRRFLRSGLGTQGYQTVEAEDAASALRQWSREQPDLIILDLGLPDRDGLSVIGEIRESAMVPIIVLSVRDDERGKVLALELGADDYVVKPFGMAELVARVKTALRHRYQSQGVPSVFRLGHLGVDLVHRIVTCDDIRVELSPREYDVLSLLVTHAGKVLTHGHILKTVWGPAHGEDIQYLRGYVRQLRQKLERDPAQPAIILTEPGVGYRLGMPD